jgi:hypothetical protein
MHSGMDVRGLQIGGGPMSSHDLVQQMVLGRSTEVHTWQDVTKSIR